MAEALGVAASGIAVVQLAAKVGKSIIKLRQLWDELQDVPSAIANLLDQIDCLDPALWAAENTFGQASLPSIIWDDSIASRSTAYCRKALDSLNEIVDELAAQIHRPGRLERKLGRLKVILKKEQLKCLESRLQSAARMLTLAQQSYLVALTRVQPEIIIQRFTEITTPLVAKARQDDLQLDRARGFNSHRHRLSSQPAHPDNDDGPEHRDLVPHQSMRRQDVVSRVRFRLPTWLCQRVWEFQSSRSYGDWRINLLSYRTVPHNSEVFRIAGYGKLEELHALFDSGVASPYDRDVHSQTLLHKAVHGANKPVVEYLLGTGLNATEVDDCQFTPIKMASVLSTVAGYSKFKNQLREDWSTIKGFEKFYDVRLADADDVECSCWDSLHSRGHYTLFRRFECPWHKNTTLESRLRTLASRPGLSNDPAVIPDILQPYWSEGISSICALSMSTCFPLIHLVAVGMAHARVEFMEGWASLADVVIGNTSDVHHIQERCELFRRHYLSRIPIPPLTPLTALILALLGRPLWPPRRLDQVNDCLKLWLSKIKSNGHDLEEYGSRENELLADEEIGIGDSCTFVKWDTVMKRFRRITARLRGYECGPEPDDWRILWSFPEKGYAADFWRLVEDGVQLMPGAWVEDDDDGFDDIWF